MYFSTYRFELCFETKALLPRWKGSTLRGALGRALRGVSCTQHSEDCKLCLLRYRCPYHFLFNSSPPPGARSLRKLLDVPRPFVAEPPGEAKSEYEPRDSLAFNLNLFGSAVDYLPYFIVAFRNLGGIGIGGLRYKGHGRFRINSLRAVNPLTGESRVVYSGDGLVHNRRVSVSLGDFKPEERDRVKLVFTAPTRLKEKGRYTSTPSFRTIMRSLLSRLSSISEFYCDERLDLDYKRFLGSCEDVKLAQANTRWWTMHRAKMQGKQELYNFFYGELQYQGDITPEMMQFLEAGKYVHVGNLATFGCGRYEVI